MADLTSLGIVIDAGDIKRAVEALNKLQQASKEAEKNTKALGDTAEKSTKKVKDGADQAALALQREARAQRATEQAALAKEKTATQTAKTAAVNASIAEKALNQEAARIRAATRLEEGLARQRDESAKRLDLISTKQAQAAALQSKYTSQAQAIQERASAYTLNQQSLIEQRALKTQNSITASAQRAALMQEKFEFQKAQAAERAARRQVGAFQTIKDSLATFSDVVVGGFGISAIVDKAVGIVKVADNLTLLDSRLKLATKSQEDFVKTQNAIRESSLKTGLNLEAQVDGFTQLERSTRALKLTSEQLTFLTESFGKAAVVSGASTESYKSALTQLNQGFASGVIRGQEFNSVAEQAPAIMEALASGLRGSNKEFDDLEKKGFLGVAALRKLAGEGKLVNGITIPALIEGLKQTNKQFDEMPLTVQRATEQIGTAYKVWISNQNNAAGATSGLANTLGLVASNFQSIANTVITAGGVIGSVIAGKLVASVLTSEKAMSAASVVTGKYSADLRNAAASALQQAVAEQAAAKAVVEKSKLQMLSATQITQAQNTLSAATDNVVAKQAAYNNVLKSTTISAAAARTATTAFSTVLGALGGPIGIGITAIIALITYWDDLKKAIFGATAAHSDFMKQQAQITTATRGEDINRSIQDQIKHTEELRKQYAALNKEINSGAFTNPRTGEVDAGRQQRASEQLARLSAQIRESTLKANELDVVRRNRNALVTQEVVSSLSPTKIGGGPLPDGKPPKAPSLLGAKETEIVRADSAIKVLQEEIALAKLLGTAKDNLNEHEIKAIKLARELEALNPAAKNYAEAKSNIEAAIAVEKKAGALQKELDGIQARNKAIADWEKATDKVIEKQEDLARYTAVDLGGKVESAQEVRARKVKENYEAALKTLRSIDEVLNAPAGVTDTQKRQKLEIALGTPQQKSEANFESQVAGFDAAIGFAQQNGDLDLVQQLEEQKTAIVVAESEKRMAQAQAERDAMSQNISAYQGITGSLTDILKNAGQEQSGIYKALFAVNKAFSIAQSIISIQTGIAQAAALPFPANLPAMASVAAATAGIVSTISGTDMKFAKGAAFSGSIGSGVDVLTTPTTFPMSGGRTGVGGEVAGSPEAIMPLSRDANGRLGVNVNGGSVGGNSNVQQNNIQITVNGGSTNEETAGVISRELLKTMERIADSRINNAKRPNGILTR